MNVLWDVDFNVHVVVSVTVTVRPGNSFTRQTDSRVRGRPRRDLQTTKYGHIHKH